MKGYSIGLIWQDNRVAPVDQGYLDLVSLILNNEVYVSFHWPVDDTEDFHGYTVLLQIKKRKWRIAELAKWWYVESLLR